MAIGQFHDILPFGAGADKGRIRNVGRAWVQALEHENALVNEENERLKHAATHDVLLSSLYNRAGFDTRINELVCSVEQSKQDVDCPVAIMYLDLDQFKSVNDTHGHEIGDGVLKAVETALNELFERKTDIIARVGGDEFAVAFPLSLHFEDEPHHGTDSRHALENYLITSEINHDSNGEPREQSHITAEDILRERLTEKMKAIKMKKDTTDDVRVAIDLIGYSFGLTVVPSARDLREENRDAVLKEIDVRMYASKREAKHRANFEPAPPKQGELTFEYDR